MLFNSLEFIIFFLPIVLLCFFLIAKRHQQYALIFLVSASSLFVAWKVPAFLYLIFISICINFLFFKLIMKTKHQRIYFILSVLFNISYLFYYKYYNFSLETLNLFFHLKFSAKDILLPLAISFYTFQQISFLHDAINGKVENISFLKYSTFVLFFPQLIAGPIIRHHELLPEIAKDEFYRPNYNNLALGLSIFSFGLFKKVVFADAAGNIVDLLYGNLSHGNTLSFIESWLAVFAFSFQIYFDFSGYSDMAVGLGRMFNVKFPQNFNSPYKATSMIDFWRRWHISLSTFLKENLYIPLGGGHRGRLSKVRNLLITMLLGGLWHGASWTFVAWGGLHGMFLSLNHLMRGKHKKTQIDLPLIRLCKQIFVFLIVSLTWVFFRSETFSDALKMYESILGLHGFGTINGSAELLLNLIFVLTLYLLVLLFPNTFDWHCRDQPSLDYRANPYKKSTLLPKLAWRPNRIWAVIIICLLFYAFGFVSNEQEFIYFQF